MSADSKQSLFTAAGLQVLNRCSLLTILAYTCWYTTGFNLRRQLPLDVRHTFDYGMNYERSLDVAAQLAYPPWAVGFLYPPPNVVLRLGLGQLGFEVSAILWMGFLIVATLACFEASLYLLGLSKHPAKYGMALLALVSVEYFVETDLRTLNGNVIYLAVLFGALVLSHKSKEYLAGFCLAVSIGLKLYSVVFLPYFLFRRQYRLCLAATVWLGLFFFALPAAYFGADSAATLTRNWLSAMSSVGSNMAFPWEYVSYLMSTHRSLLTLLTEKGGRGVYNLMNLRHEEVFAITRAIQFLWLCFVAYYFWRSARNRSQTPSGTVLMMDAGVLTLAVLPVSPVLQPHHGVVMLIPAILLVTMSIDSTRSASLRWSSLAVLLACAFESQFGPANALRGVSMLLVIALYMGALYLLRMSEVQSSLAATLRASTDMRERTASEAVRSLRASQ